MVLQWNLLAIFAQFCDSLNLMFMVHIGSTGQETFRIYPLQLTLRINSVNSTKAIMHQLEPI